MERRKIIIITFNYIMGIDLLGLVMSIEQPNFNQNLKRIQFCIPKSEKINLYIYI
jgi:hypothetical protein